MEILIAQGQEWLPMLPVACLLPMQLARLVVPLLQDPLQVGLLLMSSCRHQALRSAQPVMVCLGSKAPLTVCLQTEMLLHASSPCHRLRGHRQMQA